MAEGKNKIVIYADWRHAINVMPDDFAGKLFKQILNYCNEKGEPYPDPKDPILNMVWQTYKATFKRDLKKWEKQREANRVNGSLGGRPKGSTKPKEEIVVQPYEKPELTPTSSYTQKMFFEDWNEIRTKKTKTKSALNSINNHEAKDNFRLISKNYSRTDVRNALAALFFQKQFPRKSGSFTTDPNHFLKFFERYLQAWFDQDKDLYQSENNYK